MDADKPLEHYEAAPADPGTPLADPGHTRGDLRMVRRAVRKRWNVPDDKRDTIAAKVAEEAEKGDQTAQKIVLEMERQNQADEHMAEKYERLDGGKTTELVKVIKGIEDGA